MHVDRTLPAQYWSGSVHCSTLSDGAIYHTLLATSQLEVCSGPELSGIIEATTPESQLVDVGDILQKLLQISAASFPSAPLEMQTHSS